MRLDDLTIILDHAVSGRIDPNIRERPLSIPAFQSLSHLTARGILFSRRHAIFEIEDDGVHVNLGSFVHHTCPVAGHK